MPKTRKPRPSRHKPAGLLTLSVPTFPRLEEYVGVWAIEPRAAAALWQAVQGIDIAAHVRQSQDDDEPPTPRQQYEVIRGTNGQNIAVIKATGVLMKQVPSMTAGTSTIQLRRDIRAAAADPEIVGILLAIDSPGGTVSGIADLTRDVAQARRNKPLWVQIEDMGASAAYQVASQAEKIFANSSDALVGSIGTMMAMYDLSGLAEKEGIRTLVFGTGPLKGAGTPGAKITEDQEQYFQALVNDLQRSFSSNVKKGRGLSDKQLAAVTSGAVFVAPEALDKKLIDGIQPLEQTIDQLAAHAKRTARASATRTHDSITTPAHAGRLSKGTDMFEQWLQQQGIDSATLTAEQLDALEELYTRAHAKPQAGAAASVDVQAEIVRMRQELAAETNRVAAIRQICADKGNPTMADPANASQRVAVEAHAIGQGWDVQRTEMAASLEQLRQSRPQGPGIIVRGHERDCTLESLQGAMILRFGGRLDAQAYQGVGAVALDLPAWMRQGINGEQRQRAMEWAHKFSNLSMLDLCREACRIDGRDAPLDRNRLVQSALSGSTLTNIFTTSVNARMLVKYMETGDTTVGWTRQVDVPDFKQNERIRLKKGGALKKLPRGATADHVTRQDVGESYKIGRYAGQFAVDEQDFIDDNMGALMDMPDEMGLAARRIVPDLVYAILFANAALDADNVALFHTNHANTDSSAALAADKLKAGITKIRVQTDNGVNLNLMVTHLIVPSTLDWTGRELLNSTQIVIAGDTDTLRGNANTLNGLGIQLVSESRLDNGVTDPATGTAYSGDTNDWFLAAAGGHTIEVGFLQGTGRVPQVRTYTLDKGQWGIGWDVNHNVGAKALDYRSLYRGQG